MPIPRSRLSVYPNPYIVGTIDHLGRPAGRVPLDPFEGASRGPNDAGVGAVFAEVKETHSEQAIRFGQVAMQMAPARHDHRIAYERGPIDIRNTGYYRDAIMSGSLFAADAKTFVTAGGAASKFVPYAKALEAAKAQAIEHFNASTGEDAHEEMGAFEPLWIGEEKPADNVAVSGAAQPKPVPPPKSFQPDFTPLAPVSGPALDALKPSVRPPAKASDDVKGDAK